MNIEPRLLRRVQCSLVHLTTALRACMSDAEGEVRVEAQRAIDQADALLERLAPCDRHGVVKCAA